jgi:hypothetical protein
MTVIINPSYSAISVIARQVAQGASGPDADIVHAVLSQISLEDTELPAGYNPRSPPRYRKCAGQP